MKKKVLTLLVLIAAVAPALATPASTTMPPAGATYTWPPVLCPECV